MLCPAGSNQQKSSIIQCFGGFMAFLHKKEKKYFEFNENKKKPILWAFQ